MRAIDSMAQAQEALRVSLNELIQARGESLSVFGATLAHTLDAQRKPFSRQYVHRLRTGADIITPEIARAIQVLGAMFDGASELQARAHEARVWAVHDDLDGGDVFVLGRVRPCSLAGCRVRFVPASPAQRYCSPECRVEAARRRQVAVKGVR